MKSDGLGVDIKAVFSSWMVCQMNDGVELSYFHIADQKQ